MLVLEAKLKCKTGQYNLMDEAICTALFVRNKALRLWMDKKIAANTISINTALSLPKSFRLIQCASSYLATLIANDPLTRKFCQLVGGRGLVVMAILDYSQR